jgi:hypothetical protein
LNAIAFVSTATSRDSRRPAARRARAPRDGPTRLPPLAMVRDYLAAQASDFVELGALDGAGACSSPVAAGSEGSEDHSLQEPA